MFGELQQYSNKNNITMSIYVDDITFSSNNNISYENKRNIYKIISNQNDIDNLDAVSGSTKTSNGLKNIVKKVNEEIKNEK